MLLVESHKEIHAVREKNGTLAVLFAVVNNFGAIGVVAMEIAEVAGAFTGRVVIDGAFNRGKFLSPFVELI